MPFSELELVVGKLVFEAEVLAAVSALVVGGVERVWSLDLGTKLLPSPPRLLPITASKRGQKDFSLSGRKEQLLEKM